MKRYGYLIVGLVMVIGLMGVVGWSTLAQADGTHKLITLRGKLLASITWSSAGSGETLGSLFSTASYDTTDEPYARPDQRKSVRGPMLCWTKLDQVISISQLGSPVVSVFIQHAPSDTENEYTNLMYLTSANRVVRGNGFQTGVGGQGTTLNSQSTVVDSLSLAAVTDGAFGRYIRGRFILTGYGITRNEGVRASLFCEVSGDTR